MIDNALFMVRKCTRTRHHLKTRANLRLASKPPLDMIRTGNIKLHYRKIGMSALCCFKFMRSTSRSCALAPTLCRCLMSTTGAMHGLAAA